MIDPMVRAARTFRRVTIVFETADGKTRTIDFADGSEALEFNLTLGFRDKPTNGPWAEVEPDGTATLALQLAGPLVRPGGKRRVVIDDETALAIDKATKRARRRRGDRAAATHPQEQE